MKGFENLEGKIIFPNTFNAKGQGKLRLPLALWLLLGAIAFGVNWMAFEQRRANSGFFIGYPQAQSSHSEGR